MEDGKIVELYWARKEEAIACTQEKYDRYLMKIAWNVLSDEEDSRESVNDTYLAAWNSIPPQKPMALSAYLGKLARRISIDCFRGKNRQKRAGSQYALSLEELEDCVSGGDTTEALADGNRLKEAINTFLRQQDAAARNLFIGRYYYMDSLKEAAAYCGMSESKAKSLLYRTRLALKAYLEQEGFTL